MSTSQTSLNKPHSLTHQCLFEQQVVGETRSSTQYAVKNKCSYWVFSGLFLAKDCSGSVVHSMWSNISCLTRFSLDSSETKMANAGEHAWHAWHTQFVCTPLECCAIKWKYLSHWVTWHRSYWKKRNCYFWFKLSKKRLLIRSESLRMLSSLKLTALQSFVSSTIKLLKISIYFCYLQWKQTTFLPPSTFKLYCFCRRCYNDCCIAFRFPQSEDTTNNTRHTVFDSRFRWRDNQHTLEIR